MPELIKRCLEVKIACHRLSRKVKFRIKGTYRQVLITFLLTSETDDIQLSFDPNVTLRVLTRINQLHPLAYCRQVLITERISSFEHSAFFDIQVSFD